MIYKINEDINVKIDTENYGDALKNNLYELAKWDYIYDKIRLDPIVKRNKWNASVLKEIEEQLDSLTVEIAGQLKPVYEKWLESHAITEPNTWAKARVKDMENESNTEILGSAMKEYYRYYDEGYYNRMYKKPNELWKNFNNEVIRSPEVLSEMEDYLNLVKQDLINSVESDEDRETYENYDTMDTFNFLLDTYGELEDIWGSILDYNNANDILVAINQHIVFPVWYDYWSNQGIDETRATIEEAYDILKDIKNIPIKDRLKKLNWVINVSHQTGDMIEYISNEFGIRKSVLDDISNISQDEIKKWEYEISKELVNEARRTKSIRYVRIR